MTINNGCPPAVALTGSFLSLFNKTIVLVLSVCNDTSHPIVAPSSPRTTSPLYEHPTAHCFPLTSLVRSIPPVRPHPTTLHASRVQLIIACSCHLHPCERLRRRRHRHHHHNRHPIDANPYGEAIHGTNIDPRRTRGLCNTRW